MRATLTDDYGEWPATKKAYRVEVDPADESYPQDVESNWRTFQRKGRAWSYEFRSRAEYVRKVAASIISGVTPRAEALRATVFDDYMRRLEECFPDEDQETLVARLAKGDFAFGNYGAYYVDDSDAFLSEAVEVLKDDLPRWASVQVVDDGGPGSGFTTGCLVLTKPHTLDELASYLATRVP